MEEGLKNVEAVQYLDFIVYSLLLCAPGNLSACYLMLSIYGSSIEESSE